MQTEYDPNEAIKVWSDGSSQPQLAYGRKLKFSEKCGILAALVQGARHQVIMKAFGLSRATVSQLATCLNKGAYRYADVAREYHNFGAEEFRKRYYTEELHWRLMRVRNELPKPGDVVGRSPDPRASKFSYANY